MGLMENMLNEVRDALKTKGIASLTVFALGTDDTTDEGPTNNALDARIAASDRFLTWSWDEENQELSTEIIYGFDGADAEGSDNTTNGQDIKEMAMYTGDPDAAGVLRWRHVVDTISKTAEFRLKIEVVIKFFIDET